MSLNQDEGANKLSWGPVAINFATVEGLTQIPGIKTKLAKAIVSVRENTGNVDKEILQTLARRTFSQEILDNIDFTKNSKLQYVQSESDFADEGDEDDETNDEEGAVGQKIHPKQPSPVYGEVLAALDSACKLIKTEKKDMMDDLAKHPSRVQVNIPVYKETSTPAVEQLPAFGLNYHQPSGYQQVRDFFGNNVSNDDDDSPPPIRRKQKSSYPDRSVSDISAYNKPKRHVASLPKNLTYDGKGNWKAFKMQFTRYAAAFNWTEQERLNCLCWSLKGKALDYYALISDQSETQTYSALLKKLGDRFGEPEIPAAAQARFQQATQHHGESLEEWADRVLTLASLAYKELPDKFCAEQAVNRFCQGMVDKEAGHHVCMQEPHTVQQAIQLVRKYQQVHSAMYGKSKADRYKKSNDLDDDTYTVSQVAEKRGIAQDPEFKKALKDLEERLQRSIIENRVKQDYKIKCFFCGKRGHIKRQCPKREVQSSYKGSGRKAEPRPK